MTRVSWWQTGVIYQIYPRSFLDANDDGIGDLRGIAARLDYLVDLGVGAVWICPIFASPMADFGYDISDYNSIDPRLGTMADFDALIKAAHDRDLKVILDFVPNHTSDEHPWFHQSRASRHSPRRDWYIWRDPAQPGVAPNNWLSEFGGSAWEFDELTGQYYYHAFLARQPDLNWRNPSVRSAMHEVMRFWLRKGVDGFRVDVIWHLAKDDQYRDNPINPQFRLGDPPNRRLLPLYTTDRPEVHDFIAAMRRVIDEFDDRVLIGEIYLPIERLISYYGRDLSGVHLPFNFSLIGARWEAQSITKLIDQYEAALPPGGWPNWVLGNHDRPRIASRVGPDQARVAAMLLLTLRGTPTIYYGDEIGMQQVPIPPGQICDPLEKNVPGQGLGRDGARTPLQWDAGKFAGFSTVTPWLPVAANYARQNIAKQSRDPGSIYRLYRRLVALRREQPALRQGTYRPIAASGDLLLYTREFEHDRIFVALNLGPEPTAVALPSRSVVGKLLASTFGDRDHELVRETIDIRGNEGVLVALAEQAADALTD
jgi:alpha-glucosidase